MDNNTLSSEKDWYNLTEAHQILVSQGVECQRETVTIWARDTYNDRAARFTRDDGPAVISVEVMANRCVYYVHRDALTNFEPPQRGNPDFGPDFWKGRNNGE